jgi:DNA polymerase I-like protein with 3'-5' exonuclease and polymerase domains
LDEASREQADLMQRLMPPRIIETTFIPKRDNRNLGRIAGVPEIKRTSVPFNPNSPPQIRERLIERGATLTELTDGGEPSVKANVLATIDLPEARAISAYKVTDKVRTMLCGEKGWLTQVGADGRLHTSYRTLGTVTGRCAHSPNVAQVVKVRKDKVTKQPLLGAAGGWGWECRSLFGPPEGWWQVGIDQSGLELRCLAHYLSPWDGGAYAAVACDAPHDVNAAILGASREASKTFVYAMVYGAGHHKLGSIIEPELDDDFSVRWIGQVAKQQLIDGIAGFSELFQWLDGTNGDYIEGLDGRRLFVRKKFARLNTLLQSAGAILCKRWALLCDACLQDDLHLVPGRDYLILASIHDELQIAARTEELAEVIGEAGVLMAAEAGRYYDLRCPLDGEFKVGRNWASCH